MDWKIKFNVAVSITALGRFSKAGGACSSFFVAILTVEHSRGEIDAPPPTDGPQHSYQNHLCVLKNTNAWALTQGFGFN